MESELFRLKCIWIPEKKTFDLQNQYLNATLAFVNINGKYSKKYHQQTILIQTIPESSRIYVLTKHFTFNSITSIRLSIRCNSYLINLLKMIFENNLTFAQQLDQQSPLRELRNEFLFPQQNGKPFILTIKD